MPWLGGRKDKPDHPLMISVQKVRMKPAKEKGKTDGWFPQPVAPNGHFLAAPHQLAPRCVEAFERGADCVGLCALRLSQHDWAFP